MSKKISFIQCYGNFDYDRSDQELQGLQDYYTAVGRDILDSKPEIIVLMGGYTSSDTSEAESTFMEFLEDYIDLYNLDEDYEPVLLFQNSGQSASQNLAISLFTIQNHLKDKPEITIYCDSPRHDKTEKLATELYATELKFTVKSYPRLDIHPHSNADKQAELVKTELDSQLFKKMKDLITELLHSAAN
jgi:hypothetical protein